MFIAPLFIIVKCREQTKCPSVVAWIKKTVLPVYNGTVHSTKNKEFLPFMTVGMKLEAIMLSEISQLMKDKYPTISLKRNLMNKIT